MWHLTGRETFTSVLPVYIKAYNIICGVLELLFVDFVKGLLLPGAETTTHCSQLPRKPQSYPMQPSATP